MRFSFLLALILVIGGCQTAAPGGSASTFRMPPASVSARAVDLTWERAYVYLPAALNPFGTGVLGGRRDLASVRTALDALAASGRRYPVVVYLHGCGGFGNSGRVYAGLLAEAGFVIVGPDSFARPERIKTCDGKRKVGIGPKGSYSQVIAMRIRELERALEGIRDFPWADGSNLFLFGHSQGSNAAAYYDGGAFRARVMTGTRCSRGYRAPAGEPALAVSSRGDPWFRGRPVKCLDYVDKTALRVLMLDGNEHVVAKVTEARRAILEFLNGLRTP